MTWSGDGTLDPIRVHHGHYARFVADPIGAVSELYGHFGLQFTRDTAQAMRDGLAARPQDKHGVHRYSFDDLGLDQNTESRRFARYRHHFGVPAEGAGV